MVVLLDGGFSSQLQKYVDEKAILAHPLWCAGFLASHPDAVINVHCDYIKAGCEVILTNTYQSSIEGFKKYLNLSSEDSLALIKTAVHLARQAIKQSKQFNVQVAGSVGPYGASLHDGSEYRGDYVESMEREQLEAWHRPRIAALVSAGVDLLAIETIPALDEAIALVHLLKNEFPQQKFWISFSCKDESHISHGELFSEAVTQCCKAAGSQLIAVGANCVAPPQVAPLLASAQGLRVPFIAYPNGGGIWNPGVGWMDKEDCPPLAHYIAEWVSLGVRYVGGCCGSTAEDIQLCRKYIDSLLNK